MNVHHCLAHVLYMSLIYMITLCYVLIKLHVMFAFECAVFSVILKLQ